MSLADGFGEHNLEDVVSVLVRLVEAAGAAIIFVGAVIAFARFLLVAFRREGLDPFAPPPSRPGALPRARPGVPARGRYPAHRRRA